MRGRRLRVCRDTGAEAAADRGSGHAGCRSRRAGRRRPAHVLGSDPPCARPRRSLSARRQGLPDPFRRRCEREDARAGARREGRTGRWGSSGDPLSADSPPARDRADTDRGRGAALSRGASPREPAVAESTTSASRVDSAPAARASDATGWRRRRHGRRARLRPAGQDRSSGSGRSAGSRLRRLELRRDRRDGEGRDLRLPARQGHRSRHPGEADAADPGGRRGREGQTRVRPRRGGNVRAGRSGDERRPLRRL